MIFKQDSGLLGLFIGVFTPIIFYLFQDIIIPIILGDPFSSASMELFSLILNLPLLRYYLINLKYEKTGKGILFATFIYAIIWVYVNQGFN